MTAVRTFETTFIFINCSAIHHYSSTARSPARALGREALRGVGGRASALATILSELTEPQKTRGQATRVALAGHNRVIATRAIVEPSLRPKAVAAYALGCALEYLALEVFIRQAAGIAASPESHLRE